MKIHNFALASAVAWLCLLISLVHLSAQPELPPQDVTKINAFVAETTREKSDLRQWQLALWLPFEFFQEVSNSVASKRKIAAKDMEKELAVMKPYLIIIAANGVRDSTGKILFASEKQMKARAIVRLPNGASLRPIDKVPFLIPALTAGLKSGMASSKLGGRANDVHVLVFPNKGRDSKPVVNAARRDTLTLILKPHGAFPQAIMTWRTPFKSLNISPP